MPWAPGRRFANVCSVDLAIASTLAQPRPAHLRRARWVLACLCLLAVLMPLRAWAMASMGVSMLDAATTTVSTAAVDLPPCHAPTPDDPGAPVDHGACAECVWCAPLLAGTQPGGAPVMRPYHPPAIAVGGEAPAGALEALFRPPRG